MGETVVTTGFAIAWPWLLTLLPVPWLLRALLPAARSRSLAALKVPWFTQVASAQSTWMRHPLLALIAGLIWGLLVFAAARPQWVGEVETLPVTGRDLLLAVDISGSMDTQDMIWEQRPVNRLLIVKNVAGEFIQRRRGDRVGLILFGSRAYLQTPLTFDRKTLKQLLNESAIGIAGQSTAIGDAIGLALKRLQDRPTDSKVLILLTDGQNRAGEIQPLQAAELAAQKGLKIYTIGVGAEFVMSPGLLGTGIGARRLNPSADLDEKTLTEIANITGGRYFRAKSTESLKHIYEMLDELEPVDADPETFRPIKALFHYPLGLALLLSVAIALYTVIRNYGVHWRLSRRSQQENGVEQP